MHLNPAEDTPASLSCDVTRTVLRLQHRILAAIRRHLDEAGFIELRTPVIGPVTDPVPGYTTVAARTESGRCVVLWQNGMDLHNPLSTKAPFVQAALAG